MTQQRTGPEYKFVKYSTHNDAEKGLNEMIAEGWQLVSYQCAGDSSSISHFVLLSRDTQRERRMGFGNG